MFRFLAWLPELMCMALGPTLDPIGGQALDAGAAMDPNGGNGAE